MALNPSEAHGTQVKIGNGASTEVFTAIEGIFDGPGGLGFSPQILEKKVHSQVAPIRRVSSVGIEPQTFSIVYDSTNAQHTALETAAKNKTRKNFETLYPDAGAAKYAYSAYVGFVMDAPVEDFLTARVTLTIDGDITIT